MNIDIERLKTDAAYWDRVAPYANYAEPVGNANLSGVIFYDSTPIKSGMIKKPEATQWDGEGWPPVGAPCEFEYAETGTWINAKVIGYDGPSCVVALDGYGYTGSRDLNHFRPIRTPRERWVEAAYTNGLTLPDECDMKVVYEQVYDAMQSGQLPLPEVEK